MHDLLFAQHDLGAVLGNQEQKMLAEIDGIERNALLNTSVEDLCDQFEQKYRIEMIKLNESEVAVEQNEAQVDISQDPFRLIFDRDKPFYIKGTGVTFYIPFEGEPELFKCQPSSYTLNPPRGAVVHSELVLHYTRTDHNAEAVKSEFTNELSRIKQYLESMADNVSQFNTSIRVKAKAHIESRRDKLLKDQGLVAALGFPLRRREAAPQTYVTPAVRRKPPISKPQVGAPPFTPEPTLDMQEYEHILSVISNMVTVMERSPKAFSGMSEEDLRQHFLVQLNGHYEGQATGETFNFEGKTDILIRVEGKNIFVAECKFWRGPESLKKALDQLLGYATWRDTKSALLIFNREKQLSTVLAKIPEVVKVHPNYKRDLPFKSETGFRFVLHHRDDRNREIVLTILVFEVPA